MVILILSLCNEGLHEREFVDPIAKIVEEQGFSVLCIHYSEFEEENLKDIEKVIICGTSLMDFGYSNYLMKFDWLKETEKPILGICAGMQVIGKVFNQRTKIKTEIGLFSENFKKDFLGLLKNKEVWHLHNHYVEFDSGWEVFCEGNEVQQAVKHKKKEIYGCLFHPEVRNPEIVWRFLSL